MRPGEWAPAISAALGATEYINPDGGRALFDVADFARRGIRLTFAQPRAFTYPTPGAGFVPDLSVLDALLWNPPEVVGAAARACMTVDAGGLAPWVLSPDVPAPGCSVVSPAR